MNQIEPSAVDADSDSRQVVYAVDDEPMILELVRHVLEPLGYLVHTFTNPDSALRAYAVADPAPALVLTDYTMDKMTGLDLIRECCRINPGQKTILSSGTVDEMVFLNSPVKPSRFLGKPFQLQQLADLVKDVLAEK